MAIRALEGLSADWYTPLSERESDDPTRFKLKPLNSEHLDLVMEGAERQANGDMALAASGIKAALRFGLVDWENFCDSRGAVKCTWPNFGRLPWALRQELASEIVNRSLLSEDDTKNS